MPTLFTPPDMPEDSVIAVEVLGNQTKVQLLHVLGREGRPMTNLELADALETNKVSIRRNLLTLEEQGLVTADRPREDRAYQTVRWSIQTEKVQEMGRRLTAYATGQTDT